jgi:hypothetical protein
LGAGARGLNCPESADVMPTNFECLLEEQDILRSAKLRCNVVDEAQRLICACGLFKALALIETDHKLLLRDTPLQSNL